MIYTKAMQSWLWCYKSFNFSLETQRKALCALYNGNFGTQQIPEDFAFSYRIAQEEWFALKAITLLQYTLELNLQSGMLKNRLLVEDHKQRQTEILIQTFIHAKQTAFAAQQCLITPKNWSEAIEIQIQLKETDHLTIEKLGTQHKKNQLYILAKNNQTACPFALCTRTQIFLENEQLDLPIQTHKTASCMTQTFMLQARKGKSIQVEKIMAFQKIDAPKKDFHISTFCKQNRYAPRFHALFQSHQVAWKNKWYQFDITFESSLNEQRLIHLYCFHLLQQPLYTIDPISSCFILPFFNLKDPQLTQKWLTLNEKSKPNPQKPFLQALLAYQVWQYYLATADRSYLEKNGIPLLLKTALFLSGQIKYNARKKKYEFKKTVGLDPQYDDPQSNHALSHLLTLWVFTQAPVLLDMLSSVQATALKKKLNITKATLTKWQKQAQHLCLPLQPDLLIMPFEDFSEHFKHQKRFEFPEMLFAFYLFGKTESLRLLKQLEPTFSKQALEKNIDYHAKHTNPKATLSQLILASLKPKTDPNARSQFLACAKALYTERSSPSMMGASIDLFLRGYGGIAFETDMVSFAPSLPQDIQRLQFRCQAKAQWFKIELDHKQLILSLEPNHKKVIKLGILGKYYRVAAGRQLKIDLPTDLQKK